MHESELELLNQFLPVKTSRDEDSCHQPEHSLFIFLCSSGGPNICRRPVFHFIPTYSYVSGVILPKWKKTLYPRPLVTHGVSRKTPKRGCRLALTGRGKFGEFDPFDCFHEARHFLRETLCQLRVLASRSATSYELVNSYQYWSRNKMVLRLIIVCVCDVRRLRSKIAISIVFRRGFWQQIPLTLLCCPI